MRLNFLIFLQSFGLHFTKLLIVQMPNYLNIFCRDQGTRPISRYYQRYILSPLLAEQKCSSQHEKKQSLEES